MRCSQMNYKYSCPSVLNRQFQQYLQMETPTGRLFFNIYCKTEALLFFC